jgi:KUP system potassium uptake protein
METPTVESKSDARVAPAPTERKPHASAAKRGTFGLAVGAVGVVYGDIGTSPLYALKESFGGGHGLPLNHDNVVGVLSVMAWALLSIVTLKYVTLMMRADNRGEGGIMALMALVRRSLEGVKLRSFLLLLGMFGAALFYGDGMITRSSARSWSCGSLCSRCSES